MAITQVGVSSVSDELLAFIAQYVKADIDTGDLQDFPPYAGQNEKFLGVRSNAIQWLNVPPSGIAWRQVDTDVVCENKGGYLCSGGLTLTLPAGIEGNDIAIADDNGVFAENPITIVAQPGETINGDANLVCDIANAGFHLAHDGTEWRLVQVNNPLNIAEITDETLPAGQQQYNLRRTPPSRESLLVVQDGRVIPTSDYSLVANQITFGSVRTATVNVRYLGVPSGTTISDTPVGMLGMFPKADMPDGWLLCNGQTVSRTLYPDLVQYLSRSASATSAIVPDYRNQFMRAWDAGTDASFSTTLLPVPLGANLVGRPLTSLDPTTQEAAWDNNPSTSTFVNFADQYIGYRFDFPVIITAGRLLCNDENGVAYLPTTIVMQWSDDGVNWVNASAVYPGGASMQNTPIELDSSATVAPHQYWRILGDGGLPYPGASTYWNVRTLHFDGTYDYRPVGDQQQGQVATHTHNLTAGELATALPLGTSGQYIPTSIVTTNNSVGNGGYPDNVAVMVGIKAFHTQSQALSNSDVSALRQEVGTLSGLVSGAAQVSQVRSIDAKVKTVSDDLEAADLQTVFNELNQRIDTLHSDVHLEPVIPTVDIDGITFKVTEGDQDSMHRVIDMMERKAVSGIQWPRVVGPEPVRVSRAQLIRALDAALIQQYDVPEDAINFPGFEE